jgi:hypothetical protein
MRNTTTDAREIMLSTTVKEQMAMIELTSDEMDTVIGGQNGRYSFHDAGFFGGSVVNIGLYGNYGGYYGFLCDDTFWGHNLAGFSSTTGLYNY